MRFLVGADLSPRVIEQLHQAGHEAVHVVDLGLERATDEEIVDRAELDDGVVISSGTDFGTRESRASMSREPNPGRGSSDRVQGGRDEKEDERVVFSWPRSRFVVVALIGVSLAACGGTKDDAQARPPAKLLLAPSAGEGTAALYPERPTTYVLDGELASLGTEAPVRRMIGHDVIEADVVQFAGALGLHGAPVGTATGFEVHDGDAALTIDTSGAAPSVEYSIGAESVSGGGSSGAVGGSTGAGTPGTPGTSIPEPPTSTVTLPPPVDVPSVSEARDIAQSLLDRLGVLTGENWSREVTDAGGVAVACPENAECPPAPSYVTARSVDFRLVLDGAVVQGIGWTVTIGEHRRIEAVAGTWARPETVGTYALRSTNEAFDDLRHGRASFPGPQPLEATPAVGAPLESTSIPAVVVHIGGVTMGAARWDGVTDGRATLYIVPTYRFHARIDEGEPYDVEVLALDPALVDFITDTSPTSVPRGVPVPAPEPQSDR